MDASVRVDATRVVDSHVPGADAMVVVDSRVEGQDGMVVVDSREKGVDAVLIPDAAMGELGLPIEVGRDSTVPVIVDASQVDTSKPMDTSCPDTRTIPAQCPSESQCACLPVLVLGKGIDWGVP